MRPGVVCCKIDKSFVHNILQGFGHFGRELWNYFWQWHLRTWAALWYSERVAELGI
jgi:hypothetical protein